MRQYIIAGNWKMNKTVSESIQLAKDIVEAPRLTSPPPRSPTSSRVPT